jgi:hypothetical protein
MKMRVLFNLLIVAFLVGACAAPTDLAPLNPTEQPATLTTQTNPIVPTSTSEPDQIEQEPTQTREVQTEETPEANCPGEEINNIGQGIADEYDFTSYEEVMAWFCSGAEFEDILVALQTEDQTGTPAEEMLVMLADGFSWEEIWLVVGLAE